VAFEEVTFVEAEGARGFGGIERGPEGWAHRAHRRADALWRGGRCAGGIEANGIEANGIEANGIEANGDAADR
jgi:hypothetical protein